MIRLAIHLVSALVFILLMGSTALGGMIYQTNGSVESHFGALSVSHEALAVEFTGHESAALDATRELPFDRDPLSVWQLNTDLENLRNTLLGTMGSVVDIDNFDGLAGVDELLGDNEINSSYMVAPLQNISVPLHHTTVAQVESTNFLMPAQQVPIQELPHIFLRPSEDESDLRRHSHYVQQLTISAITHDSAMAAIHAPSSSFPWKGELPNHQSNFPRDAMLTATGSDLISRSLKLGAYLHPLHRSEGEAPPRRSTYPTLN